METLAYTIPETSPTCYISGVAALNIISGRGTGDWHEIRNFLRPRKRVPSEFLVEKNSAFDPFPYFGNDGIFECGSVLQRMGVLHEIKLVYAATHARAIADMVLGCVLSNESPEFIALDDWMPKESDKREVRNLLARAEKRLKPREVAAMQAWYEHASRERP